MYFVVFWNFFGTFFERWTHFRKDGHIFGKMDTKRKEWTHFRKDGHIFGKMDTKRKEWTQNGKNGHKTERMDTKRKEWTQNGKNGHKTERMDIFDFGHFLKIDNNFVQYNILVGVILYFIFITYI